jgi:glutamyl-tRNA reductase
VLGEDALSQHKVLMIGAGEMAECCLRHLQKKGRCDVVVANRSLERAQKLAREFKGKAVAFDERYAAMADADVVISSTGSASTVIHRSAVEMVMQARADHPLMLIDIAVPRDIDPDVAEVAGVHLHDIDALESTVRQTLDRWEEDLEVCEQIIDAEIDDLFLRFKRRQAAQNALHDRAQQVLAV